MWAHKKGLFDGYSSKYHTMSLVYYEEIDAMYDAICREKQLKKRKRIHKIKLIEARNPYWEDLAEGWFES